MPGKPKRKLTVGGNPFMQVPVSAIIPCHNSQNTLERAVNSVHQQTHRPAELILIDNASEDNTVQLMKQLQAKYGAAWLKIIVNEVNVGASSSRNRAWNAARQPYAAFLDSDDSWHSRKVEIQYGYMAHNPEKVVTGHTFEILRDGASEKTIPADYSVRPRRIRELLFKNYFVTPGIMLQRNIPERFHEGRSDMEDHLMWIELCFRYGPIDQIQLPLAYLHKAQIGEGGLASRLWAMEKGELLNYRYLLSKGRISASMTAMLTIFSLIKFARRVIRVNYRKLAAR